LEGIEHDPRVIPASDLIVQGIPVMAGGLHAHQHLDTLAVRLQVLTQAGESLGVIGEAHVGEDLALAIENAGGMFSFANVDATLLCGGFRQALVRTSSTPAARSVRSGTNSRRPLPSPPHKHGPKARSISGSKSSHCVAPSWK
jgi:hypothetical protein